MHRTSEDCAGPYGYFIDFEVAEIFADNSRDHEMLQDERWETRELWYREWGVIALHDIANPSEWWGGDR